MKVLLLAGTGAIGSPLSRLLVENGDEVHVTSRSIHDSIHVNLIYHQGNAHDSTFINDLLSKTKFDCIVDFMIYDTDEEFKEIFERYIHASKRYIFLSSCRVFDNKNGKLNEMDSRLIDSSIDDEFRNSTNYAIQKAREENIMRESPYNNWSIVRPYITFNNKRFQLGILEKEWWLFRALNNHPIVLSKDIFDKSTTITYGGDVAKCIKNLIHSNKYYSESINLVQNESMKWSEILEIYISEIENCTGVRPTYILTSDSTEVANILKCEYQYKYDRLYDRLFDNSKCNDLIGNEGFSDVNTTLRSCIREFILSDRDFSRKPIRWDLEEYFDKIVNENKIIQE